MIQQNFRQFSHKFCPEMSKMKYISLGILIAMIGFHCTTSMAMPGQLSITDPNADIPGKATAESDWLVGLIQQLFGLTVPEFLDVIYKALVGVKLLVEQAAHELEKILVYLLPEAKETVETVISVALKDVENTMQPILDQLDEILPIISGEVVPKDLITDLIEQVLGITFQELLLNITDAMLRVNTRIMDSILDLNEVAGGLTGEPAETLEKVVEEIFIEQGLKTFIGPLLDMLHQIFPDFPEPY